MLSIGVAGPGATIQDAGRFGLLRFGVTPAGPMDPHAHATANLAIGNPAGNAAIEIGPGGLSLTSDRPVTLAFAGGAFAWSRDGRALPAAGRIVLKAGEALRAKAGAWGQWTYLAVPGGIDAPVVLGSRATHTRSALGGVDGRALVAGDRLRCRGDAGEMDDASLSADWLVPDDRPLRVILGPQDDHFTADALAAFLDATWTVSASADRMAYALDGPALAHAGDFNIVSDGVALGAVQVAGDGRPLVLMADRQPTGGYPKIAHVARADIGRLAQSRPGQTCRFAAVAVAEARRALLALEASIATVPERHLQALRTLPTAERLAASNLVGGVTDGH